MSTPYEMRNEKSGNRIAEAFNKKYYEAYYVATKEEALEKALSMINKEDVVSWGGCHSAEEVGLIKTLQNEEYKIIDRGAAKDAAEKVELMRRALLCDVYIGGANAITEKGEIVNIDGNGNRVAAMTYGPKSVIVIVGMNKVCPDIESAVKRARHEAAPINCQRFNLSTPCSVTGQCADCHSPECICNVFQIIRHSKPAGRIKVIIVGESLGY